ncbi:MAG: hypothetical protein K8S15_05855 [Candidatus Aegiribacteria sp.]|nr:hypothetical protein [Candidatus Aegiribacteria sp.]
MKKPQSIPTLLKMLVYTAWMVMLVLLLLNGRYKMHIAIHLWPIIAIGAILSGLFLASLVLSPVLLRKEEESRADLVDTGILLFPLIYLVFSAGDQLGAYAYSRRSISMVESLDGIELQPGSSGLQNTVMHTDLYSLLSDYGCAFERTVTLEGSLINTDSISGNMPVLFRFLIVCCVNDAIPYGIYLEGGSVTGIPDDQWLRVTGTADTLIINEEVFPFIKDLEITVLESPECPYMYP